MAAVDLLGGWGQSNSKGYGTAGSAPTPDPALCWEWDEDNTLDPLADPGVADAAYAASTGSMFPALFGALTDGSNRPAVLARAAVGGSPLLATTPVSGGTGRWSAGGAQYDTAVTRLNAAKAAVTGAGHTIASVGVVWHQGERDIQHATSPSTLRADYKAALIDLLARARAAVDPALVIYVCQVGNVSGYTSQSLAVQEAQAEACAETDGLELVYSRCKDFGTLGWMQGDNLHYTQAGYNDMGATAGATMAGLLGFDVEPPPVALTPRTSLTAARMFSLL